MKKLYIHCGLHKTGTTSFQLFCTENRSALNEYGVYYPPYLEKIQHSYLLHDAQKSGIGKIRIFLQEVYHASDSSCHTVLLSGEDFENCLADLSLAQEIEEIATSIGFASLTWVVVVRDQIERCESLYSEISKHKAIIDLKTLATSGEERGCFHLSTKDFNHIFIIDSDRFIKEFEKRIRSSVIQIEFHRFISPYPGRALLECVLTEDKLKAFDLSAIYTHRKENLRISNYETEANYLATFLGAAKFHRGLFFALFFPIILIRILKTKRTRKFLTRTSKN